MAVRENADARVRYGRILGIICIVAGFTAITLGWNGSASRGCVDCQFPYFISGGIGGLALVVFGSSLLIVSALRAERMHLQDTMERVGAAAVPTADLVAAASAAPAKRSAGSTNGTVVVGRSTYHRPDCRLVQGKEGLDRVTVDQAAASGLSACRVCNPARADAAASAR